MAQQIDTHFRNRYVDIVIPAQRFTAAQSEAIRKSYEDGSASTDAGLRFHCAIAEAVNEAFGAKYNESRKKIASIENIRIGRGSYRLNSAVRAQFGVNKDGNIYLTVGLIRNRDGMRYRLTWLNDAVPERLARVAVAHDRGESHPEVADELYLELAELHIMAENTDPRRNHDSGNTRRKKDPEAERRRIRRRVCTTQLAEVYG